MANYRISATTLDSMWAHTLPDDDRRHLTATELVRRLTGKSEPTWPMFRGQCLHKIMEQPVKYFDRADGAHWLPINEPNPNNVVAVGLYADDEHATRLLLPDGMDVERKYEQQFCLGWDTVTLVCVSDVVTPRAVMDYKFSEKAGSQENYTDKYQWRVNLLLAGVSEFRYRHIQIGEKPMFGGRMVMCEVKEITDTVLYNYADCETDVLNLCDELVRFAKAYNIEHHLIK